MENRAMFTTLFVAILGSLVHGAFAETFEAAVPCTSDSGCSAAHLPSIARCQSGFCICMDGNDEPKNCSAHDMHPKFTGRNPAAVQACKNAQDCNLPNEFCNTTRSQCACSDGYVMASETRRCLLVASSLGSSCEEDIQCQKTMGNTSCLNTQCVCSAGYRFRANNTCVKSLDLGDRCSNDDQCSHIDHAECDEQSSICVCSNMTSPGSDNSRCLVAATEMLEPCVEKSQCTKKFPNSDCIDKRCQCTRDNHFERSMSQCVSSRRLGERCGHDHECFQDITDGIVGQAQKCVDNICVCNENFHEENEKCLSSGASSPASGIFLGLLSGVILFCRS